ncbi:RNA polymerase sigma factor [Parasediminibacterium sp. JCM 36343]|uniref:RNA polymerase sigma factor n=1 Tax=Parasediminibacterium sp. JCM 36343 TaxID=3374279 RepID=UPI00397A2639
MAILRKIVEEQRDQVFIWQDMLLGDKKALELIMNGYMDMLYNYGMRFCTDTNLIEDCIQDLFIGIWQRRDYLSTSVSIKPYLFSSLRRLVIRKVKISRKAAFTAFNDDTNEFHFEFSIEKKIMEFEETRAVAQKIKLLVDGLPKRQKEIIYLKFFENLNRDEIAEIMQISPQAVSNLLQKALGSLRSNNDILPLLMLMLICTGALKA